MKCEEFEDLILDDVEGRVPESQKLLLGDHVADCESCRGFLATQMELDHAFAESIRAEISPGFKARIMQRVDAEQTNRTSRMILWSGLGDFAGVVGIAVAGGIAAGELFPSLLGGSPWLLAALLFSGGVWVISTES